MSRIFMILGKSCTGKDTIYKRLKEVEELKLKTVVMYTTRPIRISENDGVEYHFVNEETMNELMRQNKIIEHRSYQTIHGVWHYFTVDDGQIDVEAHDYLMLGTLESYAQIRDYYGKDRVLPIYLEVDDETRILRAIKRQQKQEQPRYAEMCRRYLSDEEDFSEDNLVKYGITNRYENIDLDACLDKITRDIKKD